MEDVIIEETRKTKSVSKFPEGVMELKQKILEAAIVVFNQKGMKFTMDDFKCLLWGRSIAEWQLSLPSPIYFAYIFLLCVCV